MISTKVRAGVFLLAGTLLFAGGLFLIGNKETLFSRGFNVYADFATVQGLITGANVRVSGLQAGELERPATAIDDPPVGVAREERRARRRVVIVEQLEQVREAAFVAAANVAPEALGPVGTHRPGAAVGTDEVVLDRHRLVSITT